MRFSLLPVVTVLVAVSLAAFEHGDADPSHSHDAGVLEEFSCAPLLIPVLADSAGLNPAIENWNKLGDLEFCVVNAIHALWFSTPPPDSALKDRLARCLAISMRRGPELKIRADSFPQKAETLSEIKLTALFEAALDHSPYSEEQILGIYATCSNVIFNRACLGLVLRRVPSAPESRWALYGQALLAGVALPDTLRPLVIRMVEKAYDRSLEIELSGAAEIVQTPFFNAPVMVPNHDFRGSVIEYAGSIPGDMAAVLLTHIVKSESDPDLLTRAGEEARAAAGRASSRSRLDLIKAALKADNIVCRRTAIDLLGDPSEIRQCAAELRELSTSVTEVGELARARLGAAGLSFNEDRPSRVPESLAARLASIVQSSVVDPVGARRCRGRSLERTSWGDSSVAVSMGWFVRAAQPGAPDAFVSDDLDVTFGTEESLHIEGVDLGDDIRRRILAIDSTAAQRLDRSSNKDEPAIALADLLRLAAAARLSQSGTFRMDRPAFELYRRLLPHYPGESSLLHSLVYEIAWLRYVHAVDSFMAGADSVCRQHVTALLSLESWSRPQTDLSAWLSDGHNLLRELEQRSSERRVLPPDRPGQGGRGSEYWLGRLPDVPVRQFGQPGGAGIAWHVSALPESIVAQGTAILPGLFRERESKRLVRGCSFWRDFDRSRHLVTVGETVLELISQATVREIGVRPSFELIEQGTYQDFQAWIEPRLRARDAGRNSDDPRRH